MVVNVWGVIPYYYYIIRKKNTQKIFLKYFEKISKKYLQNILMCDRIKIVKEQRTARKGLKVNKMNKKQFEEIIKGVDAFNNAKGKVDYESIYLILVNGAYALAKREEKEGLKAISKIDFNTWEQLNKLEEEVMKEESMAYKEVI